MRKELAGFGLAVVFGLAGTASAQIFDIPMSPRQEPGNITSTATGQCLGRLDGNAFEVICSHTVQNVTAAHIHRAPAGTNGGIIHPFDSAVSPFRGLFQLTAAELTDLQAGNLYVNVHSTAYPGGEIRGQIGPRADSAVSFPLEASQETGNVTSTATGRCMAVLSPDDSAFTVGCSHNVASASAAHIHAAAAGTDGSVVFGFATPTLIFDRATAGDTRFTDTYRYADFLDDLRAGGLYVNVHSPTYPSGEIRGQIPKPGVVQSFPQFGNGGGQGGVTSSVVLTNPSSTATAEGTVYFFDANGQPLTIGLTGSGAGAPASEVDFSIQPLGSVTFMTNGQGDLIAGSSEVISNVPVGGIVRFQLPVGIAGFGSGASLRRAITPARRSSDINTAIAVRNLETFPIAVTLQARGENGASLGNDATVQRTIPPNGRIAEFVNELFQNLNTSNFLGTVEISSGDGSFSAISLELGSNAGLFTSLPVTPVAGP
ncbi:MAG: CHRD domain-containing protein [Acidobacteria bacterium]|nr:MAG: CHRD domain-containing protein [Acidobacteriota bacterium]